MITKKIYSGIPKSSEISKTQLFKKASAIYLNFPSETDHFEIDFYLQVTDLSFKKNKIIQLNENFVCDTVLMIHIPIEYQFCDFNLQGAFWTEFELPLEIFAIFPENSFDQIQKSIEENNQLLTQIKDVQELELLIETAQAGSLALLSIGLSPISLGGTLPAVTPLLPFVGTALLPGI